MREMFRALALFSVPGVLLALAFALVFFGSALPPSLAGLKVYGPHIAFIVGVILATAFKRGRAVLALFVLIIAYAAQQAWLLQGANEPVARAVYAGLVIFVPINLALLALLPEYGVLNRRGLLRGVVLIGEAALVAWLATPGNAGAVEWIYQRFVDPPPFGVGQMPQLGIIMALLGITVAMASSLITRSAISAGLAGAIAAFVVAAGKPGATITFSIFMAAAELMVTIAVLQDTFRMAFRDELTGIPSRRALNEYLSGLGKNYTIAMIDVDHFKKFNDTYGHDLGDQVLKMVAAHIADVTGGGKAFRYGGEEFTVVFRGRDIAQATPHLEAMRREIESYRLALRAEDRPKKSKGNKRQKGGWRGKDGVSVTVSIGVAERNERLTSTQSVIEAADRALYRAKEKGRNQLSR